MNPTNRHPLGAFEQRLLGELRELVVLRATSSEPTVARERFCQVPVVGRRLHRRLPRVANAVPRRSGLLAAAGGTAAIAACLAVLLGLSAGSTPSLAQAFPVFAKPAAGARSALWLLRAYDGAQLREVHADLRNARAIQTPLGTGYVLPDYGATRMCLVVPGGDGWGGSCGATSSARKYGAGGIMTAGPKYAELVSVLPTGASALVHHRDGRTSPLPLKDGVLALLVHHRTTITIRIGRYSTIATIAPENECVATVRTFCPGG